MHAKRTFLASFAVLALAVGGCGGGDDSSGSGSTGASAGSSGASAASKVDIKDFKFAPKAVKVKVGDSITFTNEDKAKHTAETDAGAQGAFDSGDLLRNDSKKITFDKPGTIAYYCIYHRFMTGTVEVSE